MYIYLLVHVFNFTFGEIEPIFFSKLPLLLKYELFHMRI